MSDKSKALEEGHRQPLEIEVRTQLGEMHTPPAKQLGTIEPPTKPADAARSVQPRAPVPPPDRSDPSATTEQ